MIRITAAIAIDEREVKESLSCAPRVRAGRTSGRSRRRSSSASVSGAAVLPEQVRARLERLAGCRLTQDGVLVITAQRASPRIGF